MGGKYSSNKTDLYMTQMLAGKDSETVKIIYRLQKWSGDMEGRKT